MRKIKQELRTQRRRLFWDLETSPNVGLFWESGYKKNIDYSNIIKERAIICICWKWEDDKEVYSLHWDANQCDKSMLNKFVEIVNTAQELVAHNGDKFDLAWLRTRCLYHKIPMFPTYKTIDTLKVGRSKFRFNSNKLDYIAQFLGMGKKIKTEFGMWKNILLKKTRYLWLKWLNIAKWMLFCLKKYIKTYQYIFLIRPITAFCMVKIKEVVPNAVLTICT